jgi:hypothetical protein
MSTHKIEVNMDGGKKAVLELTTKEVDSAVSVCEQNSLDSVIIMKKHNGGAAFYSNEVAAANAQKRHGYEYAFTVKKADLVKWQKAKKDTTETK